MSGCSGENAGHATVRGLRLLSRGGGTQAPRCGSGVRPLLHGAGELVVLGVLEDGLDFAAFCIPSAADPHTFLSVFLPSAHCLRYFPEAEGK